MELPRTVHLPRLLGILSLKSKLTLGSSLIALGVLVLVYVTLSRTAQNIAASEARKRAEEIIRYFSAIIAEPLAAGDRLQIQLLASAFEKSGVHALRITGLDGEPLYPARAGHAHALDGAPDTEVQALAHGGGLGTDVLGGIECLHAAREISFGGAPAGTIQVWLDRSDLEEHMREANAPIFGIFSCGFAALLLLGFVSLRSPFRALRRLSAAAREIGAGDLTARVPVHGGDEVAEFCTAFNLMADGLVKLRQENLEKQLETIHAMINTVEARDFYTAGHCLRVAGYARDLVAGYEGLTREDAFVIQTAALLHDIGKLGIPDRVLLKEGGLTPAEIEIIRSHVTLGEAILSHMDSMKQITRAIRHHHERYDGLGYPDGLRGEAIPLASRIVGVADAIDAMLTDRPYRKALSVETAIETLKEWRGRQFDPRVVDLGVAFLERRRHDAVPVAPDPGSHVHRPELELQPA
jgi:putative nucleotidyltransferase with HDIG domain